MKHLCFLSLCLLVSVALTAQLGQSNPENNLNFQQTLNVTPFTAGARGFDNRYEGIKGSPYVFADWRRGDIIVAEKDTTLEDLFLNLNTLNQTVILQMSANSIASAPATSVREVIVEDAGPRLFRVYDRAVIEGGGEAKPKFYEVLHEDDRVFLKAHDKLFLEADYKGAYSANQTADEFFDEPKYYLQVGDGTFQQVKLRPKQLEKMLPSQKKEIKRLAKEQGLTLYEEEEWVRLLQQLDR